MGDKETLFIKCDCGKEHQLWDCDVLPPPRGGPATRYSFMCGPCGKLFNIQVIEKEYHGYKESDLRVKCQKT